MAGPKGFLVVPVGFNPDGDLRTLELDADDNLKIVESSGDLADILTALEKLDDLQGALDSVGTDELDVNVEDSVLPDGASTSAAQTTALTELAQKLETADLELVAKILSVGGHGWVGSAWRRNPLAIGFSGVVFEQVVNLSAAAGTNYLDGAACPAGEIWVIQLATVVDINTNPSSLNIFSSRTGGDIRMAYATSPGANVHLMWNGELTLAEGDKVRAGIGGAILNDDLYLRYSGYRVDIDQ